MVLKLKNKILGGLAGIVLGLSSCDTLPPFPYYGNYNPVFFKQYNDNIISIGYDLNGKGKEEIRYYYRTYADRRPKLLEIKRDFNNDGEFDDYEVVWRKPIGVEDFIK